MTKESIEIQDGLHEDIGHNAPQCDDKLCESDGEDQVQHDEMEQQKREMRKENDAMKRSFTKKNETTKRNVMRNIATSENKFPAKNKVRPDDLDSAENRETILKKLIPAM